MYDLHSESVLEEGDGRRLVEFPAGQQLQVR